MRLLGEVANDSEARRICAFLLSESIDSHVDGEVGGPFEIWVKDEDKFKTALSAFEEFKSNPGGTKYDEAIVKADLILREKEKKRREAQQRAMRSQVSGPRPAQGSLFQQAPLTMTLIGLCCFVFVLTGFGSREKRDGAVARALQFVAVENPSPELMELWRADKDDYRVRLASVMKGEVWRVISPIFIHYGPIHLIFNMIWLVQFGRILEVRYGTLRLAVIVLMVAAISNLAQCLVPTSMGGSVPFEDTKVLMTALGGMSGVVYGLFGYIWMKAVYDPSSRLFLPQSTIFILVGWLFFCMFTDGMMEGSRVANWAHGIGLVVGMALAFAPTFKGKG